MSREQEIAGLHRTQFGLVTAKQLTGLGLSGSAMEHRSDSDRHLRIHKGVFLSASVAPTFETRVLAAVLAAGERAFASHESAIALRSMPLPNVALIEVSTDLDRRPRLKGVKVHRSGLIVPEDVETLRGIRVSSAARAIVDISGRYGSRVMGRLVDDALRRRLTSIDALSEATERLKSAPGRSRKKMRALLQQRDASTAERESVLEDFVFDCLRRFKLPLPEAQKWIELRGETRRIDFCFGDEMLALEPKGFGPHSPRSRFDDDALRGNELWLAGYRVLEFTSAFSDWLIASQVARGLGLPEPRKPRRQQTFSDFLNRLDGLPRQGTEKRPNGR